MHYFLRMHLWQRILALSMLTAAPGLAQGEFNLDLALGGTASLPYGELVDHYRSFHSVSESGTTFEGSIKPLFFGTAGLRARYYPFREGPLEKLGFMAGIQYLQRGLVNHFQMEHIPTKGYTDVTFYKETYRHHYAMVPFQVSWGWNWFATMGVAYTRHISSAKSQLLERSQSGDNALNGGFENTSKERSGLAPSIMADSTTDFLIGGGCLIGNGATLELRANIGGEIFQSELSNYRTVTVDLTFFIAIN